MQLVVYDLRTGLIDNGFRAIKAVPACAVALSSRLQRGPITAK